MTEPQDVAQRWPLPDSPALRDRLLAAYDEPRRGYHDRTHLAEVLDRVEELADRGEDLTAVRLAAWFHDAVYEGSSTDEERSARLAEEMLSAAGVDPATTAEVARLVRLTADHRPEPGDRAGALLCDADLAVLASGPERYSSYVAGVRRDYAHVDEAVFRAGRAAVLRDLLAVPSLFATERGRSRWETPARENLERELRDLES